MNKKTEEKEESALALPEQYFKDNANVGLSSLTTEDVPVPGLTIVQSTSKFRDEEGRPFVPGKLYYKALKMAYDVVECSVLVITKKDMPSYLDRDKSERTYLVLGALDQGFMPFVLYAKGSAFFSVRSFIGEIKARKYPMYALKVQISTEKRQNDQGEWYVPVFTIAGLRNNPEEVTMLENLAKDYDMNSDNIQSEEEAQAAKLQNGAAIVEPEVEVNVSDIPF